MSLPWARTHATRYRRDADVSRVGDLPQRLDQREIVIEILAGEARGEAAKVLRVRSLPRPMAGDQPPRQYAIGGDPDPGLPARRQDVEFDHPHDKRIFDLLVW